MPKLGSSRYLLLASALATACMGPLTCREWNEDSISEDVDSSEQRVRELLRLTARPDRERQGFSPLPPGPISVTTPKPRWRGAKRWGKVTIALFEFRDCASREWWIRGDEGEHALALESEMYHGGRTWPDRSEGNEGRPFLESVDLRYAAPDFMESGETYYVIQYLGRFGSREIPLELAQKLGRAWACLPIPARARPHPVPALGYADPDLAELAAAATFSGVELYGWKAKNDWAFALLLAKAPTGSSPLVMAAGVTLAELLPVLAEVPAGSDVEWTSLPSSGAVEPSAAPPPRVLEPIRKALLGAGSSLTL